MVAKKKATPRTPAAPKAPAAAAAAKKVAAPKAAKKAPAPSRKKAPAKATPKAAAAAAQRQQQEKQQETITANNNNNNVGPSIRSNKYYRQLPFTKSHNGPGGRVPMPAPKGFFGRLGAAIFGSGQYLCQSSSFKTARTFAFPTAQGVQLFIADAEAMSASSFGLPRGSRLQYSHGTYKNSFCTVVGIRGGLLWVVNDIENPSCGVAEEKLPAALKKAIAEEKAKAAAAPSGDGGAKTSKAKGAAKKKQKPQGEQEHVYSKGMAVPLIGAANKEELWTRYGLAVAITHGGHLDNALRTHPDVFASYPSALITFLETAPDLSIVVPDGDGVKHATLVPPTFTPSGKLGWAAINAFDNFGFARDKTTIEARTLICIVPEIDTPEVIALKGDDDDDDDNDNDDDNDATGDDDNDDEDATGDDNDDDEDATGDDNDDDDTTGDDDDDDDDDNDDDNDDATNAISGAADGTDAVSEAYSFDNEDYIFNTSDERSSYGGSDADDR